MEIFNAIIDFPIAPDEIQIIIQKLLSIWLFLEDIIFQP